MYSLKQAAEAVGRGKPAILKAIKSHRISAHKNENGEWQIDPAELHRVYPPWSGNASDNSSGKRLETLQEPKETHALEREVQLLRERLADKEEQISDLRSERDRLLGVIEAHTEQVKLLTDQRQQPPDSPKPRWHRWFGR